MDIGGIFHLSLTVRDIRRSIAWYRDLLGLEQVFEEDGAEHGWTKIGLYHAASGTRLNFTQHYRGSGEPFSEFRARMDHVALHVVGGRAALEAWIARLDERGVDHSTSMSVSAGADLHPLRAGWLASVESELK